MKKAFSLLELIFVIVIIGIVASVAIPKFMDTRDTALVSSIKRDLSTIISSVQTYHLINGNITKISDAVNLNSSNWIIENLKVTDSNSCLYLEVTTNSSGDKILDLVVDSTKTGICEDIRNSGLVSTPYSLN